MANFVKKKNYLNLDENFTKVNNEISSRTFKKIKLRD